MNTLITELQCNEGLNDIMAYPIPTEEKITIQFEKAVTATYEVNNILGASVQKGSILDERLIKIDLGNNKEGV